MKKHNWNPIIQLINKSNNILLTTHVNPDGDGLGSESAIYYCLKKMGKNPVIINASALPEEYIFLDVDKIFRKYSAEVYKDSLKNIDLLMVFDIGDPSRLSQLGKDISKLNITSICLDHHPSENHFFDLEVVDKDAPATVCLVYELIQSLSPELMDIKIAEALYTGILTDTGSFRFENTTISAMEMAIEMIRYGVKPSVIYQNVYENNRPEKIRLLGMVLQEVNYEEGGKLAWFQITQEHIKSAGATLEEVDGFTDFVRTAKGVEVAVMFLEVNKTRVRMNFRSKGEVIINQTAKKFGGGGHPFAAGAVVNLPLQNTIDDVLPEVRKLIRSGN